MPALGHTACCLLIYIYLELNYYYLLTKKAFACAHTELLQKRAALTCTIKNFSLFFLAIKEERFRFGNGYDQVEDVIGVAQPVRFNSKHHTFILVDYIVVDSAL